MLPASWRMTMMTISKDMFDLLLSGVDNANDLLGEQGLMRALKRNDGAVPIDVPRDRERSFEPS